MSNVLAAVWPMFCRPILNLLTWVFRGSKAFLVKTYAYRAHLTAKDGFFCNLYRQFIPSMNLALIWGYFQNVWQCRFWGHGGQRTFKVKFWDFSLWFFLPKYEPRKCKLGSKKIPKLWFIWLLYHSFCIAIRHTLWGRVEKTNNLGTVCHTEVKLTFSRLTRKLSDLAKTFRGWKRKIQPWTSFDLHGLKTVKHLENNLKSKHFF